MLNQRENGQNKNLGKNTPNISCMCFFNAANEYKIATSKLLIRQILLAALQRKGKPNLSQTNHKRTLLKEALKFCKKFIQFKFD